MYSLANFDESRNSFPNSCLQKEKNKTKKPSCLDPSYVARDRDAPKRRYDDVPTPRMPPNIGMGLVPRKQKANMQKLMDQRRMEPFKGKDVVSRAEFKLSKSVPYYARKPKLPGGGAEDGGGGGGGGMANDRNAAKGIAKNILSQKPSHGGNKGGEVG